MSNIPPNVPQGRNYELRGPQIEPTAAFWLSERSLSLPTIDDIIALTEGSGDARFELRPEHFPQTNEELQYQLDILKALAAHQSNEGYPDRVPLPQDQTKKEEQRYFDLTSLSRFIHLQPVPFGAIFDISERVETRIQNVTDQQERIFTRTLVVNEGRELARMFESETPGLYHRHAMNWLLFGRIDVSPPRQARLWMALDMSIYAALSAAWHYKWVRGDTSRLLRPSEYAERTSQRLDVLFDRPIDSKGADTNTMPRECPQPSPGTPRHPSWPSGHSTFSAAASWMLEYLFGSEETRQMGDDELFSAADRLTGPQRIENPVWIAAELRKLANNIGEARLWGGVHWLSDHVAGQRIGRAAAEAVIEKFRQDCIVTFKSRTCDIHNLPPPPTPEELEAEGTASRKACDRDHDPVHPRPGRGQQLFNTLGPF